MSLYEAQPSAPAPHAAGVPAAHLIAAYREGLGLAAVMLVRGAATIHIVASAAGRGRLPATGETVRVWWCRRRADAEQLAAAASRRLQRRAAQHQDSSTSAASVDDVAAAIETSAERLGIRLWADNEIVVEATQIVAGVEEQLDTLRRAGRLRAVNRAYRTYRLQAATRGEKTLAYAVWFANYKADLVRRLASTLRHG